MSENIDNIEENIPDEEVDTTDSMSDDEFMQMMEDGEEEDTSGGSDENDNNADEANTGSSDEGEQSVNSDENEPEPQEDDNGENNDDNNSGDDSNSDASDSTEGENTDNSEDNKDDDKKVNFEEEYKKLQEQMKDYEEKTNFYNQVTKEYVANGRKKDGLTDPKKIMNRIEMAEGFNEKMAQFKKYRPIMKALDKAELMDDTNKLNLALDAVNGNPDAIKKLLIENKDKIDTSELFETMEEPQEGELVVNNYVPDEQDMFIDEVLDSIEQLGGEKAVDALSTWDQQSLQKLFSNKGMSNNIVQHVKHGLFDQVLDEIKEIEIDDQTGFFRNKPMIEKYDQAALQLANRIESQAKEQQQQNNTDNIQTNTTNANTFVESNPQMEALQKQIQELQQQLNGGENSNVPMQNANTNKTIDQSKAEDMRKRASNISGTRGTTSNSVKQNFDPMKLSDEEFMEYMLNE